MENVAEHYYISSNKYSTHERQTRRGRVYDIIFRIVTMDGVEKQKKLSGFSTKADAKQAYMDFVQNFCTLAKRKAIRNPAAAASQDKLTIAEVVPLYLASLGNQNKDSSIYDKRNIYYRLIIPQLGTETIGSLTKDRLYRWQDDLWSSQNPKTGKYYSYAYLSKIRIALSSLLTWAEERYNTKNHLLSIRKPKRHTPKKKMEFWTREEFEQFISVVDNPTYRAMFNVLFFTGRRKGEVIALNINDITDKGILFNKTYSRKTIDGSPYAITTTKNERSDITAICEPLKQALSEYTPQAPFYFGGEKPIHENTVTHAFERYIKKSGVKAIRLHDLRQSFVSMCIHLGASVYVVADLIGDTVEQVLETYGHMYEEDKQAIINKIK